MDAQGIKLVLIAFFFAFALQAFYGITILESVVLLVTAPIFILGFVAANLASVFGVVVLVAAFFFAKWFFASLGLDNILGFAAILVLLLLIL